MMANLWKDLRYALRTWRKGPGFTLVVLLTVTLSVGMTTAIFSVVNGVLLKPLPYPDPDRLVFLWSSNPELGLPIFSVAPHDFVEWKAQARSFEHLSGRRMASFNLTGDGTEPERIAGERVTEDYFPALGLRPLHGRLLLPEEQKGGGARVVVLNRSLWERRFGGDPGIVDKAILLDGQPYVVVGIVDDPLRGSVSEMWTPLGLDLSQETRGIHLLLVIARLKEGVSIEQAQAEMTTINDRLAQQYPDTNKGWSVAVGRMHDYIVMDVRPRLYILLGAVLCVLLIACANLMNLFLARISSREREIAVRAALGAGRGRMVRQLLTETLLLAVVGGGLGVLLAGWGTRALLALNTRAVPRPGEVTVDGRVLLFALGISVLTGLAAGLWPALRASRTTDLHEPLKEGSRALAGGLRGRLVRNALVLVEVSMALVLLVSAGLLIKSFSRLQAIELGFQPEGALTVRIYLPTAKYAEPERQTAVYEEILQRVQRLPVVQAAGYLARLPLIDPLVIKGGAYRTGQTFADPNDVPVVNTRMVSPDTFRAMGMRLLEGRALQPQDGPASARVVVINRSLARRLWPGGSAVGRSMTVEVIADKWDTTVVGVVADIKTSAVNAESEAEVYLPYTQAPVADATLIVRTASSNPASIAPSVRTVVSAVDRDLPVSDVQPLEQVVATALSPTRFSMILLTLFAGLALVLASVGVYGVMSYSVSQRTQEIGIRMAMGADRGDVLRMILQQSLVLALIGVVLGLAGAFGVTRFLAGQLFGVSTRDPLVFVGVAAILTTVALIASYLPARRATGVDPLLAMR